MKIETPRAAGMIIRSHLFCLGMALISVLVSACQTPATLRGRALVEANPAQTNRISDVYDDRIDTSHVYVLRIVRCTECENSLVLRRFMTPDSCRAIPCAGLDETGMSDSLRQVQANKRRAELAPVMTHYLRFLDEKRVVYGVHKGGKLPEKLDLEDRFRKRPGGKKFARGYYYTANGDLHLRLQDRRNHRLFDWTLSIQEAGKALKLNVVTTYDAQEDPVNSDHYMKNYRLESTISYNFTFHRLDDVSIPVTPKCLPCLGQPDTVKCTTW